MALHRREKLKDLFKNGMRPSQADFQHLIDSAVNVLDDGFSNPDEEGLKLSPKGISHTVMSIYKTSGDAVPLWNIKLQDENLVISKYKEGHEGSQPSIKLGMDGDIELNAKNTTITGSRKGKAIDTKFKPKADGKWHDITEDLYGIHALEIIASCGEENTGKHALLLAWATQCYGDHRKIRSMGSHYHFFGHKLKLRWVRTGTRCRLQIKTRLSYGKGKELSIKCNIAYLHNQNKTI